MSRRGSRLLAARRPAWWSPPPDRSAQAHDGRSPAPGTGRSRAVGPRAPGCCGLGPRAAGCGAVWPTSPAAAAALVPSASRPSREALRPRSRGAQHVVGVGVGTGLQRQAAAADAAGEAVAQRREVLDPVRELITPLPGDARPVLGGGHPILVLRELSLREHMYEARQSIGGADEGEDAQRVPSVLAAVARRAPAADQFEALVVVQRRDGDTGAFGDLAGLQPDHVVMDLDHGRALLGSSAGMLDVKLT